MLLPINKLQLPRVHVIGNAAHPDFAESLALLRTTAALEVKPNQPPDLVIFAQSRPREIRATEVNALQRRYPLAGIVALLGSWCEGETRTGRPWSGMKRLYWYDFPAWWRRQVTLRAAGRCPEWASPLFGDASSRSIARLPADTPTRRAIQNCRRVVVLRTQYSSIAEVLADVLTRAGYATVHQQHGQSHTMVRGAAIAIWEGGQLCEQEAIELREFCQRMSSDRAPVIALLDFPRFDRVARAREVGASVVLGKPWLNVDLIDTLQCALRKQETARAA